MVTNQTSYRLEACVNGFAQAISAQNAGAHQVELCSRLDLDGLTPTRSDIEQCLAQLNIPTKIMIRPTSGNFVTDDKTLDKMISEIKEVKSMEVRHIVLGLTTQDHMLDLDSLCTLRDIAFPMAVTIHKAIDTCLDPIQEVERLVRTGGFHGVLTSGGASTAVEGAPIIKKMIALSIGEIDIISAGSITQDNFLFIHEVINGISYHGKRIVGSL